MGFLTPWFLAGAAAIGLLGGEVHCGFQTIASVIPQIKAGKLKALAIAAHRRMAALPDVPTVAESGYKGFEADQWYGVVAPAATPPDIVRKLNTDEDETATETSKTRTMTDEFTDLKKHLGKYFNSNILF